MLKPGDSAPDFEAEDQHGTKHRLTRMLADGPVVVYFYTADFTPVCTAEACAFRDRFAELDAAGTQILGISPQGAASHKRFAEAYRLPLPLLGDESKEIIRRYGVDGPLGFGVRRATFFIDVDGRVSNRAVADFFVGSHVDLINAVIRERRKCP